MRGDAHRSIFLIGRLSETRVLIGGLEEEGSGVGWDRGALWGGGSARGAGGGDGGHRCPPGRYLRLRRCVQGESGAEGPG